MVPTAPLAPSRSAGKSEAKLAASWKQTWVAAAPANMALRLNAHVLAPTKVLPENILNVA